MQFNFHLSIGDGEEELSQMPIPNPIDPSDKDCLSNTVDAVIQALDGLDLTDLYAQLVCEITFPNGIPLCGWSLYHKETGLFEKWDGDPLPVGFQGMLNNIINALNDRVVDGNNDLMQFDPGIPIFYRLITENGEKGIFAYDDTTLYTACGLSCKLENARLRYGVFEK